MASNLVKQNKCFGGYTQIFEHDSRITQTNMRYAVHLPCEKTQLKSCIIWLSGLTCNEENFITKSGIQRVLEGTQTMVICPDTSPRGLNLPNEHESWDFGSGAGFYVNATTDGYKDHYRMYDYIVDELIDIINTEFGISDNISIMGHSMGGHGALVIGLKEPHKFKAISAFAPIVNPVNCPWGEKAFTGYLGNERFEWSAYDATCLVKNGATHPNPILIDQGVSDEFLERELLSTHLEHACENSSQELLLNMRPSYDHSYYFIATFLQSHVDFHLKYLT